VRTSPTTHGNVAQQTTQTLSGTILKEREQDLAEQARANAYVVSIQEEIKQITATDAKLKSSKKRRTIGELEHLLKESERAKLA